MPGNRIRLMSSADSHLEWLHRLVRLLPVLVLVLLGFLWRSLRRLPQSEPPSAGPPQQPMVTPGAPQLTGCDWDVFRMESAGGSGDRLGPATKRFRLAGTFVAFGGDIADSRRAILDDLRSGIQRIVQEGQSVDDVEILRIHQNSVMVRSASGEERLWLSFSRPGAQGEPSRIGTQPDLAEASEDEDQVDAFGGKRVGEHRWVYKRQALLDYYASLREEPRRLVTLFDSLKPLYGDQGKIEGYRVGIEGEDGFFDSTGLLEGDVVRRVNSMHMTNRRRAEYFIKEFVANRANAFVLEIERNGEDRKLIYQVR